MTRREAGFSVPQRGEIWNVDWSPGRGAEQTGVRPALIVQNDHGNQSPSYPNTIVVAMSTKGREIPFHVRIEPTERNGLTATTYVKCEQILTIDKRRLTGNGPRGGLTEAEMEAVERALRLSLALT